MASNYIPLPKLLKAWSRQSGELESDILINLGEHAAAGTLEFGALRRPDGPTVKSHGLTILTQQMRLSGYDSVREGCAELLESLVVSKYRIISFCDRTSTKPPRCALGLLKWLLWRDYRHSAPPPHLPESDETPNLKESARISSPSYTSEGASIPAPDHPERREHADELGDQAASEPFSERPPADAISVNAPPDVAAAPKPVGAGEDKKESKDEAQLHASETSVHQSHATKRMLKRDLTAWLEAKTREIGLELRKKQYLAAARAEFDSAVTKNLFNEACLSC